RLRSRVPPWSGSEAAYWPRHQVPIPLALHSGTTTAISTRRDDRNAPGRPKCYFPSAPLGNLDTFLDARTRGHPVVPLLHGFPTSSRMFRNLIPLLAGKYRVIAPDYPAFGHSSTPPRDAFKYTHAHFSEVIEALLDNLEVRNFATYV